MSRAYRASSRRGALALVAACAALVVLRGCALLYDHSLHSIDGAMQTWFALSHFADGEPLGSAFQSYLGVTMILALLPLYWALGGTLFASTLAAYLAVAVGVFATAYAFAWMMRWVPAQARWMIALLLVFAFYFIGQLIAQGIGLRYPLSFDPGVSLRPLRGALPMLALPVFVIALRRILQGGSALWAIVLGLVAGLGLLWSNDAGIPLVLALGLALTAAMFRDVALLAKTLALVAIGTASSAFATLMLVTHGEPGGWLTYNFRDVAGDQFWYFAPWDRASRILGPLDLPRIVTGGDLLTTLSLLVLIACLLVALVKLYVGRGSPVRMAAFVFAGASTVGTALIPQIGGHIDSAYNNITFMVGLAAPLVVFPRLANTVAQPLMRFAGARGMVAVTALAALVLVGAQGVRTWTVMNDNDRSFYVRSLGFHVTPQVGEDLLVMERLAGQWNNRNVPQDRRILSVYTSVLDIAAGAESPEPVGSLIHALGAGNRVKFTTQVSNRKPALVTTIAPDYSGWEGWNLRANWPFFESLRIYYEPLARTDQNIIWQRSRGNSPIGEAKCSVTPLAANAMLVTITAELTGIASVKIRREPPFAQTRTAILRVNENSPFTRNHSEPAWSGFPRYGVANERLVHIPAPLERGEQTTLTLDVIDGSAIGTATCSAKVLPAIDFSSLPALPDAIDTYLAEDWR